MEKHDFIICMNLHKKLKEKIKGDIFICIEKGRIKVYINVGKDIKYKSLLNDIPITKSQEQEYFEHILNDYKNYINEKYFI
jgi:hypothetical protein